MHNIGFKIKYTRVILTNQTVLYKNQDQYDLAWNVDIQGIKQAKCYYLVGFLTQTLFYRYTWGVECDHQIRPFLRLQQV